MAFWVSLISGIAASWLTAKSMKKEINRQNGVELNKESSNEPRPVVYGERKVVGTRVFKANSGSDNEYLYFVVDLCEGEIDSIGDVYIDDVISTDSRFSGKVTINKFTGSDAQAADQMLVNANIGWTNNHRLRGIACLIMRCKWDVDAFSGEPNVYAIVKGRKVYDPRTSTTAYSENPALQYRDYLLNARFGRGLTTADINDAEIIAAANKADIAVTPYAGAATQKRFVSNVILDTDQDVIENIRILLSGMRGFMTWTNGIYGLVIEDEGTSTFSFNTGNMLGNLQIQSETKQTKLNCCVVEFTDPDTNWQKNQVQYPTPGSDHEQEYLDEDNGTVLEKRVVMPTITDIYLAQDFAEMIVHRSRNGLIAKISATSEAMNVVVGQIVDVTHPSPGWSAKPFRVQGVELVADGTVNVELIEHQDSIYPWSTRDERDAIPDTNLPNPYNVAVPIPLEVSEELYTTVKSKGTQARAIFTWAAPNDAFVKQYQVEYRPNGATNWIWITETAALEARVDDVSAGQYDFRVRSVSEISKSDWAYFMDQSIAGLTAVPSDIGGFSIRAIDGQCHLSWTPVTDLDVINGGYIRIRHSGLLTGATWEDGQDIGKAVAGSQSTHVLPMLAGTYMAKAVDEGGRFSTNAVYAITNVPNIVDFNAVATITEHPSFTGVRDDMVIDGSTIKLDGTPRFILLENGDRLVTESGTGISREIGDVGVIEESGTYYFANSLDLGGVYTSRVTSILESSTAIATDLVDNRIANIDDWSNFDGEPSDKLTAQLELRTTDDDPVGSPTWSAWQPFLVGDYHCRAYEFRVVVTNEDANYNISITKLSVTVDMPDRTERSNDVTVSASGSNITFGSAFKDVPVVGLSMQDSDSGDYFRITGKTRTGFTVNCYNSSNTGISRSINWIATGYGKEDV